MNDDEASRFRSDGDSFFCAVVLYCVTGRSNSQFSSELQRRRTQALASFQTGDRQVPGRDIRNGLHNGLPFVFGRMESFFLWCWAGSRCRNGVRRIQLQGGVGAPLRTSWLLANIASGSVDGASHTRPMFLPLWLFSFFSALMRQDLTVVMSDSVNSRVLLFDHHHRGKGNRPTHCAPWDTRQLSR